MTVYILENLLLDPKLITEAIDRVKAQIKSKEFLGDLLPVLKPRIRYGFRLVQSHLFASIWSQTKDELQRLKAETISDSCYLPKDIGPCRGLEARFFFNSDLGTCEAFAVSPLVTLNVRNNSLLE